LLPTFCGRRCEVVGDQLVCADILVVRENYTFAQYKAAEQTCFAGVNNGIAVARYVIECLSFDGNHVPIVAVMFFDNLGHLLLNGR